MNRTTDVECLLGDCNWEGNYIPRQTEFKANDLELDPAATCNCSRRFKSLQGFRIHKHGWCKQRDLLIGECKSNDGVMTLNCTWSVQDPILEQQHLGAILSKASIQWPKGNQKTIWTNLEQDLSLILTTNFKKRKKRINQKKENARDDLTCASEIYTLYEWSFTTSFMKISESKRIWREELLLCLSS